MKTLHLTNSWHAASGGIGTFYRALMEAGNREGHAVQLVVPGERTRTDDIGPFGRIHTIASPRAPLSGDYRMIYPHRFLLHGSILQRIINQEKPDLIEVSEKYTMNYLAGLLRTRRLPGVKQRPTVVGLSCERMDENMAAYLSRSASAQRFCRWYMKWIYFPMFDHHIAVSEHTAAELIPASRGHKITRGIWVMPMGVDADRFTPEKRTSEGRKELAERLGISPNATILLYAGRLAPEKNPMLLIDTMRRLPDGEYHLAIAGSGILQEQLSQVSAREHLPVTFLGHVSDPERLASIYANADVFLHPNPREPFGIAPLEAMSAGLALVAPNAGGVTSYASEANAWLCEANAEAFARTIRVITADPATRAERTRRARVTALEYRWSTVTSQFLELYRELDAVSRSMEFDLARPARTYSTPGDLFGKEIEASQRS